MCVGSITTLVHQGRAMDSNSVMKILGCITNPIQTNFKDFGVTPGSKNLGPNIL